MKKEDNNSNHKIEKKEIIKPFQLNKKKFTFWEHAADFITRWAGSWFFIIVFIIFLILWISLNTYIIVRPEFIKDPFDPYPFMLLNLLLSCIVAVQAPIILMSQNKHNERDRQRAQYDYYVNRKAEREIREIKEQLNRIETKIK